MRKLRRRQLNRGFTLVELLLTLAILVTITGAAVLNMRQTNAHRELIQAAEQLRQAFYQTRNYALAPAVDKTAGSLGYRLVFTGVSAPTAYTGYRIEEDPLVNPAQPTAQGILISQDTLQTGIEYSLPVTPDQQFVDFPLAGHGTVGYPQPTSGTLQLLVQRHDRTGEKIAVTLSTITGQVEYQEVQP